MFCDLVIQVWKYLLEVQCPSVPVKEVQGGFELHADIKRNILSDRVTVYQAIKVYY